jgi:GT2 family glycosyltransferase
MPVPYKTMDEMEKFAEAWTKEHHKEGYEADLLSGMCMVFKKTLTEKIGGFDERFFPGYFEDTDFCLRAQIASKKLWVANDVFIHNYGSSSFKNNHWTHWNHIQESKKKFLQKWRMSDLNQIKWIIEREKPFHMNRHYFSISQKGDAKK